MAHSVSGGSSRYRAENSSATFPRRWANDGCHVVPHFNVKVVFRVVPLNVVGSTSTIQIYLIVSVSVERTRRRRRCSRRAAAW